MNAMEMHRPQAIGLAAFVSLVEAMRELEVER
jgi:hypothetical protein